MKTVRLIAPFGKNDVKNLRQGDEVLLSGVIYTARDAAHKKMCEILASGKRIPLDLKNICLYYCGPTPPRDKMPIGSCGPTTSSRMDRFAVKLMALGVTGMIGKGSRSDEVRVAIKRYGCIYFIATGGIGALLATKVRSSRVVLFKELGPEAVHKLEVKDFPLIVGIDPKGNCIYGKAGRKKA